MSESTSEYETAAYFFVLDFDRTLVDSDRLAAAIYTVVETETGLSSERIRIKQREQEQASDATGSLVDMWQTIVSLLPEEVDEEGLRTIIHTEVALHNKTFWLTGAESLLGLLRSNNVPFCIITTGTIAWQQLKLQCMGLQDVPVRVIPSHDKPNILCAMRVDESFYIPSDLVAGRHLRAARIVQIDDRSRALGGAIEGCDGLWVKTGRDMHDDTKRVSASFDSLKSVVRYLREHYSLTM